MIKLNVLELLDGRDEMILALLAGFFPLFTLAALFH
jgi:hypothetical protein